MIQLLSRTALLVAMASTLVACGDDEEAPTQDASSDAVQDATPDTTPDTTPDSTPDIVDVPEDILPPPEGDCVGTIACAPLAELACSSGIFLGCTWSGDACSGTLMSACENIPTEAICDQLDSCDWSGSSCDGTYAPECDHFSGAPDTCISMPGCSFVEDK